MIKQLQTCIDLCFRYLVWGDCNLLKYYGVDFYYHNIGTESFGSYKDIYNVIQGLNADLVKTKNNIGRTMKIIARAYGNNVFMDADVRNA